MSQEQVGIKAKNGLCQAWVFKPGGLGPWPSVIFYMDAFGIRPGMKQMAQHLADLGYVVLLPDLYYRHGAYGPLDPKEVLQGDFGAIVGPLMGGTDNHKAGEDTVAFLAYLESRQDVAGDKVGTVGFCMGGGMALTAAAFYPDRIAAAASFHGGNLATDLPDSPHLQVAKIKGEVYLAVADNDGSYPPEMAKLFDAAMDAAGVNYTSELYAGKAHGWMKPDMPVYDAEAAERGWAKLSELYARNLR
ncbi:dienelactone hydrolase family protein [Bradyrhizobium sp. 157]|uniref:dienelactone hydrolase family protein n=1 Tax=Bradyrhizobium sp. 157 TaxID=2782631 RepID=UPI001FF9A2A8|nr:dienelactone hydrolase family protein [Bradyrhizobium sp. 157]MCK1641361.1 dienelactone hydrolase family protein [Bradyrhizobium sp. 157]